MGIIKQKYHSDILYCYYVVVSKSILCVTLNYAKNLKWGSLNESILKRVRSSLVCSNNILVAAPPLWGGP